MPLIPDNLDHHYAWLANRNPYMVVYLFTLGLPIEFTDPGHPCHSPFACTNGAKLFLNREWATKVATLEEGCFAIGHELIHAYFRHDLLIRQWIAAGNVLGRPFDMYTAQVALDCVVNNMLCRSGMADAMPSFAIHRPEIITCLMSEDEAYALIYDENPPPPEGENGEGAGDAGGLPLPPAASGSEPGEDRKPGAGGQDVIPAPEAGDPNADPRAGQPIPVSRRIAAAAEATKEISEESFDRGYQPGGLAELLKKLDPRTLDWRNFIKRKIRGAVGNDRVSWHNLKARSWCNGVALPRRKGVRAGFVVVQIDTSGSVSTDELAYFASAVVAICRQTMPQRLMVLQVDAAVQEVFEINNLQQLQRALKSDQIQTMKGRGGTSMVVGFEYLKQEKLAPELIITLTDGDTGWPTDTSPAKEALWVITRANILAPEYAGKSVYADLT